MEIAYKIKNLKVTSQKISFELTEEKISIPLSATNSKILLQASPEQLQTYELIPAGVGIYWPLLDEDVSIEGLLRSAGRSDLIIQHQLPQWSLEKPVLESA